MADKQRQRTQKTKPRGIDPETGKPYKATEIPVPKRQTFIRDLNRTIKADPEKVEPSKKRKSKRD